MADTATKMATDGGGGAVDGRHSKDCKHDIGPGLKSQHGNNFFANFCTNSYKRIHTNEFIQLLHKLYSTISYTVWFLYQFIQFLYDLYSMNSYKVCFFILFLCSIPHTHIAYQMQTCSGVYTKGQRQLSKNPSICVCGGGGGDRRQLTRINNADMGTNEEQSPPRNITPSLCHL